MIGIESIEPELKETLFPADDGGSTGLQPLFDGVAGEVPSTSIRISLARKTYPAGRERDCAILLSSVRWLVVRVTSLRVAIPA
jgi:hypothetical protein